MGAVTTAVGILGILVGLALLWTGVKKLRLSSARAALLSVLDVAVLLASVALLGWLGVIVFIAATVIAILLWSVYMAMQKEEILTYAATQCGSTKEQIYELFDRLREEQAVKVIKPLDQARLMSQLAQRARSPAEIEQMVVPIAMLWVTHRGDLAWLASSFDKLLRRYNMEAYESMRAADIITASTRNAAATFEETVEALVAAAG